MHSASEMPSFEGERIATDIDRHDVQVLWMLEIEADSIQWIGRDKTSVAERDGIHQDQGFFLEEMFSRYLLVVGRSAVP